MIEVEPMKSDSVVTHAPLAALHDAHAAVLRAGHRVDAAHREVDAALDAQREARTALRQAALGELLARQVQLQLATHAQDRSKRLRGLDRLLHPWVPLAFPIRPSPARRRWGPLTPVSES